MIFVCVGVALVSNDTASHESRGNSQAYFARNQQLNNFLFSPLRPCPPALCSMSFLRTPSKCGEIPSDRFEEQDRLSIGSRSRRRFGSRNNPAAVDRFLINKSDVKRNLT